MLACAKRGRNKIENTLSFKEMLMGTHAISEFCVVVMNS